MTVSRPLRRSLHAAMLVVGLCLLSGCLVIRAQGPGPPPSDRGTRTASHAACKPGKGPPPHAPAHGYRAKCQYRYYPGLQVYYSTKAEVWFWIEGDTWEFGAKLPDRFTVENKESVTVELQTPYPYQKHEEVREKYAPEPEEKEDPGGPGRGRGKGPPPHAGP